MTFEEHTKRIDRLIWLLKNTNTETADELAKKLNVSCRTVSDDLEYLRGMGYVIVFSQIEFTGKFNLSKTHNLDKLISI